jgi:hypothetical protein
MWNRDTLAVTKYETDLCVSVRQRRYRGARARLCSLSTTVSLRLSKKVRTVEHLAQAVDARDRILREDSNVTAKAVLSKVAAADQRSAQRTEVVAGSSLRLP